MVGFPLLLIPLAIYNIIALLMPDVPLSGPLVKLTLVSGVEWQVTLGDILLALGLLLLLLEIIKGARGPKYLTDHLLSFLVFGGAAAEFVMLPKFGTSTFFLLSLMAMVDFFGGIALRTRRVAAPAAVPVSRPAARQAEAPVAEEEPRIEPVPAAPAPSAPSAASVAESVLQDHPTPKPAPSPAQPAAEPSPTIASPELQPGEGSANSSEPPQR